MSATLLLFYFCSIPLRRQRAPHVIRVPQPHEEDTLGAIERRRDGVQGARRLHGAGGARDQRAQELSPVAKAARSAQRSSLLWFHSRTSGRPLKLFRNQVFHLNFPSFQSDVPQEVGQVAKAVIKEAITSDFLASPDLVPRTGKGFVGDADLECADEEKARSQQFMQSYALLHLKSVALAFREATYCR